jgi:hypothetical protein
MLLRPTTMALVAGLALGAPSVMAAPEKPVAAQVESTSTAPKAAAQNEASSYAQREAKDQKVQNYQGGNTVIITMSAGALVLLLFLLLII